MKDSKEHILKTSLSLFLQKGFKEVTMSEIVKNSGFSKGAFYHYFSSKEEVFRDVIETYYNKILYVDYNSLPSDSLKSFYRARIDIHMENEKKFRNWLVTSLNQPPSTTNLYYILFDAMRLIPEFQEKEREDLKKEFEAWENVINKAKESGEISSKISSNELAKQFVYGGDGIALHMVLKDTTEQLIPEVTRLWDSLYKNLKN
ncbi:TetR/AcrR family transcriptional regulator [Abyssalbus ytuae]|uniref:TetR/AcrR family transcriptional regulator n=1 Tax=Abyssalbus ytuae TaxID=2926907 RepID=A0A9E6ZL65_9FLAO|nr:TetR/AcrR family transcriptional regulator [Abyssalbus ytuae]UOB16155.1 TetR/AcrR family transcriptional regulator [Abyssalbus ytuae]